ncbi:MAG: phosphatidylserine/phosphatidylglycerophosphate/cardiolipin synthase family protein [Bdellovibrionales bacterium]
MSFPVRYQLIDNAKKSIVLSTFSFYAQKDDGEIEDASTRLMAEKLIAAKNRGVKVLVITDGISSTMAGAQVAIDKLREAGIHVVKYNPVVGQESDLPLVAAAPHITYRLLVNQNPIANRWHEKTMIVDGTYGVIGGLNWGEPYWDGNSFTNSVLDASEFYSHPLVQEIGVPFQAEWGKSGEDSWRDTDMLVKGPVLESALQQLLLDFSLLEVLEQKNRRNQFKNAKAEDYIEAQEVYKNKYANDSAFAVGVSESPQKMGLEMRYVRSRPFLDRRLHDRHQKLKDFADANQLYVNEDNPSLYISNAYVNIINNAQKQIIWGCHSNRPPDDILEALVAAAERGVNVYLMGNSHATTTTLPDKGLIMYSKQKGFYEELLTRGQGRIRLFEWQRTATDESGNEMMSGAFHSKAFSVDGVISSIGSYNVAKASFQKHTEGTIIINDPEFAKKVEEMYQLDLRFVKEVVLGPSAEEEIE